MTTIAILVTFGVLFALSVVLLVIDARRSSTHARRVEILDKLETKIEARRSRMTGNIPVPGSDDLRRRPGSATMSADKV